MLKQRGFESSLPGLHRASTVYFSDMAAVRQLNRDDPETLWYGLFGTPTTQTLAREIAQLEGGRHTLLLPSGMAAISLVMMALLRAGDEVLIPENSYNTTWDFARHELASWGIHARPYNPQQPASLQRQLSSRSRMLLVEAAGSVTLEFPDLEALIDAARAARLLVVADNTWGSGIAYCAFEIPRLAGTDHVGVDISINALTKYASGGADVLMGAVTTRDAPLHAELYQAYRRHGWGVSGDSVSLILRGLPTLQLRYREQDKTARALATWLQEQPEVAQVFHPALSTSHGHLHWQSCCTAAAGLLTIALQPLLGSRGADAFVDALNIFRIGYSWGGPISLAMVYDDRIGWTSNGPHTVGPVVRLSIGLEPIERLREDLAQSLVRLSDANGGSLTATTACSSGDLLNRSRL